MLPPNTKTPAMVLQEFTVKHGLAPPEYILVFSKTGTHENEFHYKVDAAGVSGMGFGRSKQVAKHGAASAALALLDAPGEAAHFDARAHRNEADGFGAPANHVGLLKDLCAENALPPPTFVEVSDVGPPHCRQFTYQCKFASFTTQATANTKKQAKQLAASEMREKIRETFPDLEALAAEASGRCIGDQAAAERYNLMNIDVPLNKSIPVEEAPRTLRKIMENLHFTFEDFSELLEAPSEKCLQDICNKLEIKYQIEVLQDDPPIAIVNFGVETPLTLLGYGRSTDRAIANLIKQTFEVFHILMQT